MAIIRSAWELYLAILVSSTLCWGQGTLQKEPGSEAVQQQLKGTLTGVVRDGQGISLAAVRVELEGPDKTVIRVTTSDDKGAFVFSGLPAATYIVKIEGSGVEPFVSAPMTVAGNDWQEVPIAVVRLRTKNTTVNVVATLNQVAQAQVKEEEHQRIFGLLPNFYTSYIWDAVPLTPKLKFHLAVRTVADPLTFLVAAGVAGVEQAHKTFPGYGQGAEGYAKRYGGTYADTVSGRMLGSAILPTIFHQDPRYFYRGTGSIRSRAIYAILATVVCRGDNGQLEPNYSHVLGSFGAAGLSNLYRAPGDRRASLTFRNGLIITGGGAVVNLLREFLSRQLTPSVPSFANGKP